MFHILEILGTIYRLNLNLFGCLPKVVVIAFGLCAASCCGCTENIDVSEIFSHGCTYVT
jgi:hypothetical protein